MTHMGLMILIVTGIALLILSALSLYQRRRENQQQELTLEEIEEQQAEAELEETLITERQRPTITSAPTSNGKVTVINVFAKEDRTFAGYELLQTLLANGMRFGDMNIFHYYQQQTDGREQVLFSLASATEPGTFDLEAMGATSCQGLTLFMQHSGDAARDDAIFELMLNTASELAEELAGDLLNAKREPLNEVT